MKWVVAALVVLNAGMFLWATGQQPAATAGYLRKAVNPQSMRLLGEVPTAQPEQASGCYRVGPFYEEDAVALAAQKLSILDLPHAQRAVKEREIRVYRVYIGPFRDPETLERERQKLRMNRISDHHVKRDHREGTVISLGLFSQPDTAQVLVRKLARQEMNARAREEKRVLGPTFWLELTDRDANARVRDTLQQAKWGNTRVQLRSYPCS